MAAISILEGDCLAICQGLPADSVDLIVTSPPYADARKKTYGGVRPDDYVEWFLPRSEEFLRLLKPSGSFVLNIKEKVVKGERHTYVLELVLALKKQGWLWTEEYIWHKKSSFPGKWPNRFRDGWEHLYHFTREKQFYMDQEAVKVPIGDWAESRLKNLSANDSTRMETENRSGFGKNISNWVGKEMVLPNNVLYFPSETSNTGHSAAFPEVLPAWFIKLLAPAGGLVLDPFLGSGTTALAAAKLGRDAWGIELLPENTALATKRLAEAGFDAEVFAGGKPDQKSA